MQIIELYVRGYNRIRGNQTGQGSASTLFDDQALFTQTTKAGDMVFNLRTNFIETYRTDYGLWLNNGIVVAVEDTSVEDVDVRHIVSTTAGRTISGFEYPLVVYPFDSTSRGLSLGVVVQIGDVISGTSSYVSVAQLGKYYINQNSTITIGNPVYARTDGSGLADGSTFAQSGSIGKAIQNSGSDPNYSASTLVMLNPDGR